MDDRRLFSILVSVFKATGVSGEAIAAQAASDPGLDRVTASIINAVGTAVDDPASPSESIVKFLP